MSGAVAAMLFAAAAAAAPPYAERTLAEALRELAGSGLRLIWNSEIVPESLRVAREPVATAGVDLLRELLAPHGLVPERVADGTYAIVRAPSRAVPAPVRPPPDVALADVVVAASRYGLAADLPEAHVFLTQAQIDRLPKLADEPLRAVHRLPGAATNGLSGLAHIRGGEEGETQVLLDGMPLYEPFHLRNFLSPISVLDARVIDSLDVYTGAFPARYGSRMSAVVVASTRGTTADREQEVGASLFHAHALSAGRFDDGRGEWLAAIRRSYVGELTEMANSEYGEPAYADALAKLRYAVGEHTDVSLTALGGRDEIALDRDTQAASAEYRNDYAWLTLHHRFDAGAETAWIASYTEVDVDRSGAMDEPGRRTASLRDRRRYHAWGLKGDGTLELGTTLLSGGVEARRLGADYRYASELRYEAGAPSPPSPPSEVARAIEIRPEGKQFNAYASARWRPAPALTAEVGLRWEAQDYDGIDTDFLLSPRLNLRWDVGEGWSLRASAGRFHQIQGINELQVEDGVTEFFPAQYADHLVLGVERSLPGGLVWRVEAYDKRYGRPRARYENLFDPLSLLPELEPDRVRIAPGSATARGVELLLSSSAAATPLHWWVGYAWSTARDRIDGADVPRAWDQRHALTAGADWSGGPWTLSVALAAHQGWPTTRLAIDAATGAVAAGPRNDERFRTFASLDLRASRRWALGTGELEAYVEATNATARRNPCCVEYRIDGAPGAWSLDADERIWPRIVPSLGVRYGWR
jgi:outer membrane receptor protein involved in Fe transport